MRVVTLYIPRILYETTLNQENSSMIASLAVKSLRIQSCEHAKTVRCHLKKTGLRQHAEAKLMRSTENLARTGESLLSTRRQSHLQATTSYSETSASTTDREIAADYYGELATVAQDGQPQKAQIILQEMVSKGLEVTPQAYHGLIFSYMRAGDSNAALKALHAALDTSALKPLAATYAVVIYACCLNFDFQAAETVYNLLASGADKYPSWVAYLRGLVAAGLITEDKEDQLATIGQVEELLKEGERQGWYPDPDLYEEIFGLFCEDPVKANLAEDMLYEDLERQAGAETRHYNCILRAQAVFMGVHSARKLLSDMIEGKTGGRHRVLPNIESYNALIEGCLIERMQGFSYAVEDLEEVVAESITVGIQANKRTHTLLLMFHLIDGDIDRTLFELREVERLSAEGRILEHLSNLWLGRLVEFLLVQKCVLEVANLLFLLRQDDRSLPVDVFLLDPDGRSFYTRWLTAFFAGQHFNRRTENLEKYYDGEDEPEDRDAYLVDDTYLNTNNAVVDEETGTQLSVKDMNTAQMKTELEAKGLRTEGRKTDLSRRVQHSRGDQPIPVREIIHRQLNERLGQVQEKRSKKEVLKSLRRIARHTSVWSHMDEPTNVVDYETFVIDPLKEERETDKEHFAALQEMDLPADIKRLLKEHRIAFNLKDVESEFILDNMIFDTSTPEFKALNPNFHGREGYGVRMEWPKFGRAARLAFYMLEMSESLGGGAAIADFLEIQAACIEEDDPDTAFSLLYKLHGYSDYVEERVREIFYNKTLLLCMQTNRLELAAMVGELMERKGIRPIGPLGNDAIMPALHDVGIGIQNLIRDYRKLAEGEPLDPSDLEGEEVESQVERLPVPAGEGIVFEDNLDDDNDDDKAEDDSGQEETGELWEQGLEDEDEAILEDEEEDAPVAFGPAEGDEVVYNYEIDPLVEAYTDGHLSAAEISALLGDTEEGLPEALSPASQNGNITESPGTVLEGEIPDEEDSSQGE